MSWNSCNVPYVTNGYYAYPNNCIALPIHTTNLVYDGPNLPCSGITTCNTVTVALQKIDAKLCELIQELYDITTTTTSTTMTPT